MASRAGLQLWMQPPAGEAPDVSTNTSIVPGVGGSRTKKRGLDWDLNDWSWDAALFRPTPLVAQPSMCPHRDSSFSPILQPDGSGPSDGSTSPSDGVDLEASGIPSGQPDKRRRASSGEDEVEDEDEDEERPPLLPGAGFGDANGSSSGTGNARGGAGRLTCQVEGCDADLMDPSIAKDYHRKHKVCEMHSKAKVATVRNTIQRFCQQCSRFHLLKEFDEDKKSCRRRLASHNGRRRKNNLNAGSNGNALNEDRAMGVILLRLLKLLANSESNSSSAPQNDATLLAQLLKNLSSLAGSSLGTENAGMIQGSQDRPTGTTGGTSRADQLPGTSGGVPLPVHSIPPSGYASQGSSRRSIDGHQETAVSDFQTLEARNMSNPFGPVDMQALPRGASGVLTGRSSSVMEQVTSASADFTYAKEQDLSTTDHAPAQRSRLNFDLNDAYADPEDSLLDQVPAERTVHVDSPGWPVVSKQPFTRQVDGHLCHLSAQRCSFTADQGRTGRIVFKLFGKDPSDVPPSMQTQIYNWLLHCPTDMESYIRPGCVVLTIYLRLDNAIWVQLEEGITSWMEKLINMSSGDAATFWSKGWIYARLQSHFAFIYNGNFVLRLPWQIAAHDHRRLCVTPIAASYSSVVNFSVKCLGTVQPAALLLCTFNGKYLFQEEVEVLVGENGCKDDTIKFSCSLPDVAGRGFVEVEEYDHSSVAIPFVVAEENVCSEIRRLERYVNVVTDGIITPDVDNLIKSRNESLYFLEEFGWLLNRSTFWYEQQEICGLFSVSRFRWIITFAMEREWPAVVKKLLDILFDGRVEIDSTSPYEFVQEGGFLNDAVRKRSRLLVAALLGYTRPIKIGSSTITRFVFTPEMAGPSGFTPLHLAATLDDAEGVLEALISDPQQLGIKAWKDARDENNLTPDNYASSTGHESYRDLVQRKIDRAARGDMHIDMPCSGGYGKPGTAQASSWKSDKVAALDIKKNRPPRRVPEVSCKRCEQQLASRPRSRGWILGRQGVAPLVLIATVCIAVGLFMQSLPEVTFCPRPFLWDSLRAGSI